MDTTFLNGAAFSGLVFRNSNGTITFSAANYRHSCMDSTAAESLAILDACMELDNQKISKSIIESDSLNAITFINVNSLNSFWSAAPIIAKIRDFKTLWTDWDFMFIFRNANRASHELAHWAMVCNFEGIVPLQLFPDSACCDSGFPLLDIP
ncbi:hypothetical protein CASFOL_018860 [Castilleja foliolosa]|uniref:RNase H type-1 domain-containing protein n=1 Tax=Castilleja foliolosa TaxID=1961234 RepID=A0ABD3D2R6_9LAMI